MWSSLKKFLKWLRELVWPLLDPPEEQEIQQINLNQCNWKKDDTNMMFEYVNKYYQSEENRKKDIESKSTIFIGTFGVATAVLINLTKDLIFNENVICTQFHFFLISTMTLSVIYLCRAIWFSIKALERRRYFTIGFPDFMLTNDDEKEKNLIVRIYNCTKHNSDEINLKVDFMTMAQEYFKRAIVVVAIFSVMILSKYILSYNSIMQDIINKFEKLNNVNSICCFITVDFCKWVNPFQKLEMK